MIDHSYLWMYSILVVKNQGHPEMDPAQVRTDQILWRFGLLFDRQEGSREREREKKKRKRKRTHTHNHSVSQATTAIYVLNEQTE